MKQYQIWPCKSKQNSWINFAWTNSCAVIKSRGALKRRADVNTDTLNTPPCFQSCYYHLNCFQLIKEECWSCARLARLGEKWRSGSPWEVNRGFDWLKVQNGMFARTVCPFGRCAFCRWSLRTWAKNDKSCKHRGGSCISLRVCDASAKLNWMPWN